MKMLGVMIDCSRGAVYTVETLKKYFSMLAEMGYNSVQLYTEDTYEISGEPYFGYLRGRYSKEELKELDAYAASLGIELIPCIQTLAHLGGVTRWKKYENCTDTGDILLAEEEETYCLIEGMLQTCAECFTSRRINIGMDEAHAIGLGKYLDRHGYQNRFEILLRHLCRVNEIAVRLGFRVMMWSDMFFRLANNGEYYNGVSQIPRDIVSRVPQNIDFIYWDYYSLEKTHYDKMIETHKQFSNSVVFAGGAFSWEGFAPFNRFSIDACRAAIRSCSENGIEDIFITCWKDDGAECSLFASLPTLMCAAEFARGNYDENDIAQRFGKIFGISYETFLMLDEVNLTGSVHEIKNPSKYMLYSDPFLGIFDLNFEKCGKEFSVVKQRLRAYLGNKNFGYLYKTLASLCDVLEIKCSLGLRTREAYMKGSKEELKKLIADYLVLEKRLLRFYRAFRKQWEKECKENGFEMHDVRFGGLMCRIKHCREILQEYYLGKISTIEPLQEKLLPFSESNRGQAIRYNDWLTTAMIKPMG